jgi:hypothetical protein
MMQEITPKPALAILYALRAAYLELASSHLDKEAWQAGRTFRDRIDEALRALTPVVHGSDREHQEFRMLCAVCHLRYARHCRVVPGSTELFYWEDCLTGLPQPKDADVPCSAFPDAVLNYPG